MLKRQLNRSSVPIGGYPKFACSRLFVHVKMLRREEMIFVLPSGIYPFWLFLSHSFPGVIQILAWFYHSFV